MKVVTTRQQSGVEPNGLSGRTVRAFLALVAILFGFGLFAGHASAQTITPVTWNVVGLDSNNVSVGPNVFPVGARICNNTGSATLSTSWQAKFNWVTTDANLTRTSLQLLPVPALANGACQDIYHEVTVTRSSAAYGKTAQYNIEVVNSAGNSLATPVRTPANREIYVERLISQNRNGIDGYSYNGVAVAPGGTVTIQNGQTFDLTLNAHTATQGYEQLEKFIQLNPSVFRVNYVTSTYSANSGTDARAGAKIYADGCGWVNDLTSTSYHNNLSCTGTGKYGGTITQKYNITVLSDPGSSQTAFTVIYDFSGSSYHYNADYATGGITFAFGTPPTPTAADVSITKTAAFTGNGNYTFTLSVTNLGPAAATGVSVTDTVPSTCYTIDNNQGAGWAGTRNGNTVTWSIGNLAVGSTATLPIKVNRQQNGTGCLNTATVSSTSTDPNSNNNSSSIIANSVVSDLAVSKVVSNPTPKPGDSVTFTVTVTNLGADTASNVVVTDSVPNGYTVTGTSPSVGSWSAPNWTIASLAANASATLSITATVLGSGTYLNSVSATSNSSDPDPSNNAASAAVQPTYLSIAKTTSATFLPGDTGKTFSVVVSKTGNASLGTITVTDVIPLGMTVTAMAGTGWTCASLPTCTRTDDISATTGFPIAYPTITVTVSVANPVPSTLTNFVSVSSSQGNSYAEASVTVPTSAAPDMAISLSGLPATATSGVAYTGSYTCTNVGSAAASAGTTCAVSGLPTGVSVSGCTVSPSSTAWAAGDAVAIAAVVTCSVSGTPTVGGSFTVNGSTGATGDLVVPNNTASLAVVVSAPDMSISLAGLPTSATVGTAYTGTFTCTNVGTAAASAGTTCAVTGLPAGVSVTGCTITPSSAAWVAGNAVPVGAVVTCSVAGAPTTSGSVTVNGSTGATGDTNAANNTDSLAFSVSAPLSTAPDMSISLAGLPTSASIGSPYSGSYTCTNVGTAAASAGTTCAVTGLPAGVSVTGCTISPNSAAWVAGNAVPVGAVVTCSVSGTPTSGSTLTINGSTGATGDANAGNNTASISITVAQGAQPIPTLSQWAAMLMMLLLGFVAVRRLNRQQ